MFGNIFTDKFNKDPKSMSLSDIEEIAIKEIKFLKYARSVVSSRGNIFENKPYTKNLDQTIDAKLASYNLSL